MSFWDGFEKCAKNKFETFLTGKGFLPKHVRSPSFASEFVRRFREEVRKRTRPDPLIDRAVNIEAARHMKSGQPRKKHEAKRRLIEIFRKSRRDRKETALMDLAKMKAKRLP